MLNREFPRSSLVRESLTNENEDKRNEVVIQDDGMTEVLVEWKKHLNSQKEELENYFQK